MFGLNTKLIGIVIAIIFCISISFGFTEMVWKPKLKLERERIATLSIALENTIAINKDNDMLVQKQFKQYKKSLNDCNQRVKTKVDNCNSYIDILTLGDKEDDKKDTSISPITDKLNSMWD